MHAPGWLNLRSGRGLIAALAVVTLGAPLALVAPPACAQVRTVDPDKAIDGDLVPLQQQSAPGAVTAAPRLSAAPVVQSDPTASSVAGAGSAERAASQAASNPAQAGRQGATYHQDDLIGAAEGVFGKGAHGLADLIKDLLAKQGEPNGYIVGREGGGAIVVGVRYGSGTLYHKVEGQKPVYWTGPSVGFDAGASAGNTFVLVYNLYDTQELYKRFPGAEGRLYFVGGFAATYLRRGNVVLIPIRLGVGWRAGVNVGYMKFTHKSKWLPF